MSPPDTILPHRLPHALDGRPGIRLLSLDCFDTLLWRDVHAPADIFDLLESVTPEQRKFAERGARKARLLENHASGEVTLREIYATMLPHADEAEREAYVEREIAAEARHCYAFAPTVALMREAKRRGLPVAIVSDTYLQHDQLAHLIRAAAGDEVADLIDHIFCSSDHRCAKGEGLFDKVLRRTGMRADRILHIGDNPAADAAAGKRHGLQTLHLVQFTEECLLQLRQEKVAGALTMPVAAGFQPHRAALAIGLPQIDDAGEAMGFAVLGPLLTTFAEWLAREAAAIEATRDGRVHMLFVMRDGYLPRAVFEAAMPGRDTHAVEISRFTAVAAGLAEPGAVDRFVVGEIGDGAGESFLRQMLIEGDEASALIAKSYGKDGALSMGRTLRGEAWTSRIAARGAALADRLMDYLATIVEPAADDTLMLVDLGYNGTVQEQLEPLLRRRLGVHVAGRYLLMCEDAPTSLDKRGLIDATTHDDGALTAFMSSIAVLEQLCTVSQGSTVDYVDRVPVRAPIGIKGRQSEVRDTIQAGCLRYARAYAAGGAAIRASDAAGVETQRRAAVATLARLLFLPLPHELALLAQFEHDANLGTDEKMVLFDPDHAARGLRERGLFYLKGAKRMFLPAELRGQGLPTSLTLLAQRRFGLDLRYADFCDATLPVPVLFADGKNAFTQTIAATPTHDGYFVAAIPIGFGQYSVGVQFGRDHEWVQIESADFLPVGDFLDGEAAADRRMSTRPSCEEMERVAPHLYRCDSREAFLMVPPPAGAVTQPMMLTVVFRPVVTRGAGVPSPSAASSAFAGAA